MVKREKNERKVKGSILSTNKINILITNIYQ